MSDTTLTRDDKNTIRYFYHEYGYTQQELAEIYGVSRSTVQRVLNWEYMNTDCSPPEDTDHSLGDTDHSVPNTGPTACSLENDTTNTVLGILTAATAGAVAWFAGWLIWNVYL